MTGAEKKQRSKEAREKEKERDKDRGKDKTKPLPSPPPPTAAGTTSTAPGDHLARRLAGVEEQTESITRHAATCLATRKLNKGPAALTPAPGIVLAGLAGAGKTALVKQVAGELEKDPRTLTRTLR